MSCFPRSWDHTDYNICANSAHPINNLLREPSIISTQTTNTVNTYTVTVHTRTVHSRTEFPNANGTTSLLSSPTNSPGKTSHPLLPPLTPGDRSRLENLRQDPSVLSLLNIFDEAGHPNPKAFANTPARQRRVSTFKMLLGEQGTIEEGSMECKESDLSWAERYLQSVVCLSLMRFYKCVLFIVDKPSEVLQVPQSIRHSE